MVLTFRAQMHGYLSQQEPTLLTKFIKECQTADRTLKFCKPRMIENGILSQSETDGLDAIRLRRNTMAHEGYNQMLNLAVEDIEDDVVLMFQISQKVEQWRQSINKLNDDGSVSFSIAPSIFGLYLAGAQELARTKLKARADQS